MTVDWACLRPEETNACMNTRRPSPTLSLTAAGYACLFTPFTPLRLLLAVLALALDSPGCDFIMFSYTGARKGRSQSRQLCSAVNLLWKATHGVASLQLHSLCGKDLIFMWLKMWSLEELTLLNEVRLNYKLRIGFFFCSEQLEGQYVSHTDGWGGGETKECLENIFSSFNECTV